ncbi:polymorphic toxin-type HINT domain-containing protein [Clostridium sp. SHJSY1]|uniref:polymorphic toxin-type HINT domain-containing protein n=1 Tax=Clostridium sp. SHJSY1 TaxID=2942483 RepID=UPI002875DDED|nr:polymorphic toxin-type HINT domain-containing protein [Clostridium sp. SHJSY1]MDS0527709.1 polymorphic toxin-type HINT domain-containing protein [Clostridium sp. SHJSY1]
MQVGDFVYATDVKTGNKKYKEVLQVHIRNTNEFVKLNVEGKEIITTPGHLFYTSESIWIIARELKPGDEIISSDGQVRKVISIKEALLEETERIYNLSVEGYNTYYVSEIGLLVHNDGCPVKIVINPKTIHNVGDDVLDIMESKGGHTLERYVSKSNEDLIKRAIKEDVEAATCYTNKINAIKAVQENLRKNADKISKWLNEESGGKKILMLNMTIA